jgi:Tol biopolymer transport system component
MPITEEAYYLRLVAVSILVRCRKGDRRVIQFLATVGRCPGRIGRLLGWLSGASLRSVLKQGGRDGLAARLSTIGILVLASLAMAVPAGASFSGANGRIAYAVNDGGIYRIHTINPDGTGDALIASGSGPAWSPDGKKIAFFTNFGNLAIMNADGTGQTNLGINNTTSGVDWSPDGTKLVSSHYTDCDDFGCKGDLFTINPDGTGLTEIPVCPELNDRCDAFSPAWSPDGEWIAFEGMVEQAHPDDSIYKIRPDGTQRTFIGGPGPTGPELAPDWSPSGLQLAYSRPVDPRNVFSPGGLATANADGTNVQIVAQGSGVAFSSWSPDGKKIAFSFTGSGGIYVMNPDGTGKTQIVPSGGGPDWQPIPNEPPDCSAVTASRPVLTTPNHRLVAMTLDGATDPDGDAVTITIDGVTQDEQVEGRGDSTSPDAVDDGDGQVRIRAERDSRGDGRVYRIAFTATDGRGGSCSGTTTVSVPRKKHKAAVDSAPPSYDSFAR